MKKSKEINIVFNEEKVLESIFKFDKGYRDCLKYLIMTQGYVLYPFSIVSKYLVHNYGDDFNFMESYIRKYAVLFISFWLYTGTNKHFAYFKQLDNMRVDLTNDLILDDFIITNDSDKEIVERLISYSNGDNPILIGELSKKMSELYTKYNEINESVKDVKAKEKIKGRITERINGFLDCGKEFFFMVKEIDSKDKDAIYSEKGKCFDKKYLRYDELLAGEYFINSREFINFDLSIDEENFETFKNLVSSKYSNADKKSLALSILGTIVYNILNGYYYAKEIECPNSKTIKFYLKNKNYSLTKNEEFVLKCFDIYYKDDEKVVVSLKEKFGIDDFEFKFNGKKYSFNNLMGKNYN